MLFKNKIENIRRIINKHFLMPFYLSIFVVSITIITTGIKSNSINNSFFVYSSILSGFFAFFIWLKNLERDTNARKFFLEFCSSLFILTLLIATFLNYSANNEFKLIKDNYSILILISFLTGLIVFNFNKESISQKIEKNMHFNKESKLIRREKFLYKFPIINRIPILKSIIKRMCNEELYFSIFFIIIFIIFILVKISFILFYNGSFVDEYLNILSGINFFQSGHFAEFSPGITYNRGGIISFLVGLGQLIFNKTIFWAKIIPAILGIINFYLLFILSKKILSKKNILLLLVFYTFSSQVIFNHFYIRFFVFYEFIFLLLSVALFSSYYILSKKHIFLIGLITITAIPFSLDLGLYFCIFPALLTLVLLFILKPEIISLKLSLRVRILLLLIFSTIGSIIFKLPLRIWMLFFDTLAAPPKYGLNYLWFFTKINLPLTALFFLGTTLYIYYFKKTHRIKESFYVFSITFLFILHLLSSEGLQVVRGILYFIPIYYLFALGGLSFFKPKVRFLIIVLFIINIVNAYPPDFLQHPYIPYEVNYIDGNAFIQAKTECSKSNVIITSGRPEIMSYYGIEANAYYFSRYKTQSIQDSVPEIEKLITIKDGKPEYYYKKIPVLTNLNDLKIFTGDNSFCFLSGFGLPNAWVDDETKKYLENNSKNIDLKFKSSSNSFKSIIYSVN